MCSGALLYLPFASHSFFPHLRTRKSTDSTTLNEFSPRCFNTFADILSNGINSVHDARERKRLPQNYRNSSCRIETTIRFAKWRYSHQVILLCIRTVSVCWSRVSTAAATAPSAERKLRTMNLRCHIDFEHIGRAIPKYLMIISGESGIHLHFFFHAFPTLNNYHRLRSLAPSARSPLLTIGCGK